MCEHRTTTRSVATGVAIYPHVGRLYLVDGGLERVDGLAQLVRLALHLVRLLQLLVGLRQRAVVHADSENARSHLRQPSADPNIERIARRRESSEPGLPVVLLRGGERRLGLGVGRVVQAALQQRNDGVVYLYRIIIRQYVH